MKILITGAAGHIGSKLITKFKKKYFSKNDIIFVLSYDLNNNVVKFLKDNDYEFYFTS